MLLLAIILSIVGGILIFVLTVPIFTFIRRILPLRSAPPLFLLHLQFTLACITAIFIALQNLFNLLPEGPSYGVWLLAILLTLIYANIFAAVADNIGVLTLPILLPMMGERLRGRTPRDVLVLMLRYLTIPVSVAMGSLVAVGFWQGSDLMVVWQDEKILAVAALIFFGRLYQIRHPEQLLKVIALVSVTLGLILTVMLVTRVGLPVLPESTATFSIALGTSSVLLLSAIDFRLLPRLSKLHSRSYSSSLTWQPYGAG